MGKVITKFTTARISSSTKDADILDAAIRTSETKDETSKFGYETNGYSYLNYMSNTEWKNFIKTITPKKHLISLKGEMAGNPPHMASYGSSSRFVWNQLHDIKDIEFEKTLPTHVGNSAHLDACLKNRVFVEAKCHEIYVTSHKGCKAYKEVYDYISSKYPKLECDKSLKFSINGKHICHFDLKQIICHFLAIAAGILTRKIETNISFVYMIYNPESVKEHIEAIGEEHWSSISQAYNETLKEIDSIDMKLLFNTIFEFQKENPKVKKNCCGDYSFEFHRVDQDSWKTLFE